MSQPELDRYHSEQRKQLDELLHDSPSLKPRLIEELDDSYISARLLAAGEKARSEYWGLGRPLGYANRGRVS
jgi:hypothetical protein